MPPINLDGPELVYVQVANHIASLIESGKLQTGTRLPPERELAKTFGVAYDTVRRASEPPRPPRPPQPDNTNFRQPVMTDPIGCLGRSKSG